MDNSQKVVKRIEPAVCPRCGKDILLSTQTMLSPIISLITMEEVKEAKLEVLQRMDEINFTDQKSKDEIKAWLEKEETLLDRSDIEPLLKQIAIEQLDKKPA